MNKTLILLAGSFFTLSVTNVASADDDFYGVIESRPEGKAGTWVVGGRSVEVNEHTDIDEDHGPLETGACAEVEFEDGKVEEIESEPPKKCSK